jgi:hypothetical protein
MIYLKSVTSAQRWGGECDPPGKPWYNEETAKMKLNRDLYVAQYGLLYRVTSLSTSDDEANADMMAAPGTGLLCEEGPFRFVVNKSDKGRDKPRELDGKPMIKVEGYANAETHAVILDINNDERRQNEYIALARRAWQDATKGRPLVEQDLVMCRQIAQLALANTISGRLDDQRPRNTNRTDVYSTLMSTALGRVEWMEVADDLLIKMEEQDIVPPAESE